MNPMFKGVVGNIPEIETFPYFTTIPYNTISLDAATANSLQSNLADNYNLFLSAMLGAQIITQDEYDVKGDPILGRVMGSIEEYPVYWGFPLLFPASVTSL